MPIGHFGHLGLRQDFWHFFENASSTVGQNGRKALITQKITIFLNISNPEFFMFGPLLNGWKYILRVFASVLELIYIKNERKLRFVF